MAMSSRTSFPAHCSRTAPLRSRAAAARNTSSCFHTRIAAILGGPGEGPGEFRRIRAVGLIRTDTIVAQDVQLRRLSLFHAGTRVCDIVLGAEGNLRILGTGAPGHLLLGPPPGIIIGRRYPTAWLQAPLVHLDLASATGDSVGTAYAEQSIIFRGRNPFKSFGKATSSRGSFVTGRSDAPELRFLDAQGRLRQVVRWAAPVQPMTDDIWRKFEQHRRAALSAVNNRTPQQVTEFIASENGARR
jgi:hypothetical protein